MKKKQVLVAYNYFPHYRLPILRALARDDEIDFTFLSGVETNKNIRLIDEAEYSRNAIRWKQLRNIYCCGKKFLWQQGLLRECFSGRYDALVILGNPYSLSNWVLLLLHRFSHVPVYIWGHAIIRDRLRDKLKLFFYRLAEGVLLYNNWSRERLISLGFRPKGLHVIYNSLDVEKQVAIRESLSAVQLDEFGKSLFNDPTRPLVCFIGRFTRVKRLDMLVRAVGMLRDDGKMLNLLLIGDGETRAELQELVTELGLEDFTRFEGETYDEQRIAMLLSLADVCVSPGEVGLTAMHAMIYGVPVISHSNPYWQMPEFEAILSGQTGLFFEHNSIESLAETIRHWLDEAQGKREQIRLACQRMIESRYHPAYQAKIIRQALLGSSSGGGKGSI